jgi:hypothetical protein
MKISGASASDGEHTQNIPVHLTINHAWPAPRMRFPVNHLVPFNDGLGELASKKSKAKKQRKLQKQLKRERRVSVTVNLNQSKRSSGLIRMLSRLFRGAASAIVLFHI